MTSRPSARAALAAAALALGLGLGACGGPDITPGRLDDAVGPTFAQLYARQQQLLGTPLGTTPQAAATCARADGSGAGDSGTPGSGSGAGDDWVCRLDLVVAGPAAQYTYELNVDADGCYEADGPPALVGGRTLTTPTGRSRVNPLFAFDGCFET